MTFWNISRNNSLSIGGSRYVREPPNNLFLFLHFLNFFQWKLCGRWYLFQSRIYRVLDITISLQTIHILFLPYESSIYYCQNKSLWVPLLRNSNVSFSSFCSHSINQSGVIWHSYIPSKFPWSLCDLYDGGNLPSLANFSTAFSMRTGFRPRFTPFQRDFLNLFVKSIEYFIVSTVWSSREHLLHDILCQL